MHFKVSDLAEKAGVRRTRSATTKKKACSRNRLGRTAVTARYDGAALERLHFIRGAQTLGLKLGDIKELLDIRDRGACPCGHTQQLLEKRVADIDAEIRELKTLRRELQSMERLDCPSDGSSPWPCEIEFVKRGGERVG